MFTACVCIGDCLIFKHIMKRKLLCMDFFLLFLESIPLPKACASHIEKILSKSPESYIINLRVVNHAMTLVINLTMLIIFVIIIY
jgi:hypothetical protein